LPDSRRPSLRSLQHTKKATTGTHCPIAALRVPWGILPGTRGEKWGGPPSHDRGRRHCLLRTPPPGYLLVPRRRRTEGSTPVDRLPWIDKARIRLFASRNFSVATAGPSLRRGIRLNARTATAACLSVARSISRAARTAERAHTEMSVTNVCEITASQRTPTFCEPSCTCQASHRRVFFHAKKCQTKCSRPIAISDACVLAGKAIRQAKCAIRRAWNVVGCWSLAVSCPLSVVRGPWSVASRFRPNTENGTPKTRSPLCTLHSALCTALCTRRSTLFALLPVAYASGSLGAFRFDRRLP
jgi:hypothetical protein